MWVRAPRGFKRRRSNLSVRGRSDGRCKFQIWIGDLGCQVERDRLAVVLFDERANGEPHSKVAEDHAIENLIRSAPDGLCHRNRNLTTHLEQRELT